jgi:hypothetical protein
VALANIIAWAKQRQVPVTVFGPTPEYDGPLPRLLAYSIAWKQPQLPSRHLVANSAFIDQRMQDIVQNTWHVHYISLYREICGPNGCVEYADAAHQVPLMSDTDHFTELGASVVIRRLIDKGQLQ